MKTDLVLVPAPFATLAAAALALLFAAAPTTTLAAPAPASGPARTLTRRATARTTAPSGCLTVCASSSPSSPCNFPTIAAALASLGTTSTTPRCIYIAAGTYPEQLTVAYKGPLTLYGETADVASYKKNTVTVAHAISSAQAGSLDASSTVNVVAGPGFRAYNLDFVNGFGKGAQAVAVTVNADKAGFYGCGFRSYQDTLYAKAGRQYYSNCYIEGAVDYIFGDASAWLGECTIASNGGGAITASSRQAVDDHWFVIDSSSITAATSATSSLTAAVYLGRPWRALARVMVQHSTLSDVVNPAGWSTLAANATPIFQEFGNSGAGAATAKRLYETAASAKVERATVLGADQSWLDLSY